MDIQFQGIAARAWRGMACTLKVATWEGEAWHVCEGKGVGFPGMGDVSWRGSTAGFWSADFRPEYRGPADRALLAPMTADDGR